MRLFRSGPPAAVAVLLAAAPARAGMPAPFVLTEVGRMRMESLSFFLMLFLVSAGLIQLLWNYLRKDFTALPRMSYGKALGVTTLWGLLFVLVLTMISGARELLTPGAWERSGATYKLAQPPDLASVLPAGPSEQERLAARRLKMEELRFALWDYSRKHGGQFPAARGDAGFAPETWEVADPSRMKFVYHGSVSASAPLAYEPDIFDGKRLVLVANGEIKLMDAEEIGQALRAGRP